MGEAKRNFIKGRMNKTVDERLVPDGEYIDALNIRLGSTEASEVGSVENAKGNTQITTLEYNGSPLSANAKCIGALDDSANETVYWFVHDPANVDMIVSYNTALDLLKYHVISIEVLNFNPDYLITGVDKIDDLLFFTDNYNPPRKINVNRNYPQPFGGPPPDTDGVTAEALNVIKAPPSAAPGLTLAEVVAENNYLETRFVRFAYRYRYRDNEYSALSQFTDYAFENGIFNLDPATNLNEGMRNRYNAAVVSFNTGGSEVIGIDVCFKLSTDPTIRVIERYKKSEQGWPDSSTQQITFTGQKIHTVLPDAEILRLYDNVPKLAQAQTLMGNRLMYGNYVEQYDVDTRMRHTVDLITRQTNTAYGVATIQNGTNYTVDLSTPTSAVNAVAKFDYSGEDYNLFAGGSLTMSFTIVHRSFSGGAAPTTPLQSINIIWSYNIPNNYNNLFELVNASEFQALVNTYSPISGLDCNSVTTLSDVFNCRVIENLAEASSTFQLNNSGITTLPQPFLLTSNISTPNEFTLQIPAVQYLSSGSSTDAYEYFELTSVDTLISSTTSSKSLHSNRDYEVGVVYMDDYKRSTNVLTSSTNTITIPASASTSINKLQVTLPTSMIPPSWATSYKFALKESADNYEVIYSNFTYENTLGDGYWLRLEGEDQAKVEVGSELIVKYDSYGATQSQIKTAVLEKVSQPTNFLDPNNTSTVEQVPGLYIRVVPDGYSLEGLGGSFTKGEKTAIATSTGTGGDSFSFYSSAIGSNPARDGWQNGYAWVDYPLFEYGGGRIAIQSGAIVNLQFEFFRPDVFTCGGPNGASRCQLNISIISNSDYSDFVQFFNAQNVGAQILAQVNCEIECEQESGPNIFTPSIFGQLVDADSATPFGPNAGNNQIYFYERPSQPNLLYMRFLNGTPTYGGFGQSVVNGDAKTSVNISIANPGTQVCFETVPSATNPDVFYESSENFAITGGYHTGNIQNQSATQAGIVELDFYNCYTFGNGVESQKVEDSILGSKMELGARTLLSSNQEYKEAHRFADITYSGVYNDESNINKLNEFNLGLLNFKPLEDIYGTIQKMSGRKSDVLVLQEDRISYVLAGKNLLSDAGGGSALTTVPEVLGTQIARVEEYGISLNPESFAEFGFDKYFTDAKRGAVILLRGSSAQNEQLEVISKAGMRSWFRDLFNTSFDTQKLGGYDPYMDEYVVSSNDVKLPIERPCIPCGITQNLSLPANDTYEYCVDVGTAVGPIVISWGAGPGATPEVSAEFGGTTYGPSPTSPITITNNSSEYTRVDVTVTSPAGAVNFPITVNCPTTNEIDLILITLNNDSDAGKTIHNQTYFESGSYDSATFQTPIELQGGDNPVVSQYTVLTGNQGEFIFPPDSSTVYIQSNKIGTDNFQFDPAACKFLYHTSNTEYNNTPVDIGNLLNVSTALTNDPITPNQNFYQGTFTMPTALNYTYLIWDYRTSSGIELCTSAASALDAACNCPSTNTYYLDGSTFYNSQTVYTNADLSTVAPNQFYALPNTLTTREQVAGLLQPAVTYLSCLKACNSFVEDNRFNTAYYEYEVNLGSATGVSVITFTPGNAGDPPIGIEVTYDGVTTSDVSATSILDASVSPVTSFFNGPIYGDDSGTCGITTGTIILDDYAYSASSGQFAATGTTTPITLTASDYDTTSGGPGSYILYVSKTSTTPSTVSLTLYNPCSLDDSNWRVDVGCPAPLASFSASAMNPSSAACSDTIDSTFYHIPVAPGTQPGQPARRDWMFKDVNGVARADAGYYKIGPDAGSSTGYQIQVDGNGVIVQKNPCP